MRPSDLQTKIFLDSGNPEETKSILEKAEFLDGQTTNPSLVSKNPGAQGKKFTRDEINAFYKEIVTNISTQIPEGSVSIEVYADQNTTASEIVAQAREMYQWISNAHIKIPITSHGLEAGKVLAAEGMRLNFTLCFSQEQAAAVHIATRGATYGQIFISPFIGRLDDVGQDGMSLIKNIDTMLSRSVSHVELLAASIRSIDHLLLAFEYEADIVTVPFQILNQWIESGMPLKSKERSESTLQHIEYKNLSLSKEDWSELNINHELTTKGLLKFAEDWNALLS